VSVEYKHLGRSGLKVSRLALGTMNFGWVTDEAAGFSIMDEALEQGINFFDTADVYGGPQSPDMEQGYGTSEEIIGRWSRPTRPSATSSASSPPTSPSRGCCTSPP
jgi:aryl-alcohol dehydrogenase-like predicted oxidoreductase